MFMQYLLRVQAWDTFFFTPVLVLDSIWSNTNAEEEMKDNIIQEGSF